MSIVPPLPSPIGTRYTLVFGTHFHPFGGFIFPIDGGFITVEPRMFNIIPHKCKCWCISINLSPISLLKIARLSDLSQKRSRHAVKTSNVSYHTKPYISQEIYNLTTPWQPFLIQSTPTPFQFTKTSKPDYVLKNK